MVDVKVKFCGLTRRQDAVAAVELGAAYLGVVLVSGSPRSMSVKDVPTLLEGLPTPRVLVFSDADAHHVLDAAETAEASVIQLHGEETPNMASRLRDAGPWEVWKAIRVRNPVSVEQAVDRFGDSVDGILMDTWHPHRLGGTGISFPWSDLVEVRKALPTHLRFILAGGLRPENVLEALAALAPDVVDVSSGVEGAPGVKDRRIMEAFMTNVRSRGEGDLS